jgi:hypothetical protein
MRPTTLLYATLVMVVEVAWIGALIYGLIRILGA